MFQEVMRVAKVEFTAQNLDVCICPGCPVQGVSDCADERMQRSFMLQEVTRVSDPKTLVRLYCAVGITDCGDFDGKQMCVCPNCQVWLENRLASRYFCLRGNADEIDISSSTEE